MWLRTGCKFFAPSYSPPGAMAAAGLVAPELEITDSNFSIQTPNRLMDFMYRNFSALPQPASAVALARQRLHRPVGVVPPAA